MSFLSALLHNIDNQDAAKSSAQLVKKEAPAKPSPPQKHTETQSLTQSVSETEAKPVEKLEGNDGGDLGVLIRAEKDHTYVKKGNTKAAGSNARIFGKIRKFAGPAAAAALGQTCHYFFSKILSNRAQFSKGDQAVSEIKVNFLVDFAAKDDTQVRRVPLKNFEVNKRVLGQYWFRVVSEASQKKGAESNDALSDLLSEKKSAKVNLHGGFSFKVAGERGPFYNQKDLTSTIPWLNACLRLVGDSAKKQEVSGPEGSKVILSRFGLGGNRVKVETVFPYAKKDETDIAQTPSVHHFDLAQFCIAIHSTAKKFLPLVGTCVQELPKGTAKEAVDSGYVDREKILKDLLRHKELAAAIDNFDSKLQEISGPEVTNYFRERELQSVRHSMQQKKEEQNIRNFFFESIAEELEEAKRQAKLINDATETAKIERQKAKDQARLAYLNNKAAATTAANNKDDKPAAQTEEKDTKAKKIVKKVEDKEGFTSKKTYLKTGAKEEEYTAPPPAPLTKAQRKAQHVEQNVDVLVNNPFAATRFETAFQSVADEQYNASLKKVAQREQAQLKQTAQASKKGVQPQQPQKGQQQPQKGQQQPAQKGQQQPAQKGQQQPAQKGQQQPAQKDNNNQLKRDNNNPKRDNNNLKRYNNNPRRDNNNQLKRDNSNLRKDNKPKREHNNHNKQRDSNNLKKLNHNLKLKKHLLPNPQSPQNLNNNKINPNSNNKKVKRTNNNKKCKPNKPKRTLFSLLLLWL